MRHYKLSLGETLIEKYLHKNDADSDEVVVETTGTVKKRRGMPSVEVPTKQRRLSQAKHLPKFADKQGRCRRCHTNKTYFICKGCNIRLCLTKQRNCFETFHSEE